MKKIMFLLAFVSMGIFANASNGKGKSLKLLVKKESTTKKQPLKGQWMSSFTCGGLTYTVCCFDTREESHAHGVYLASQVCD